MCVSTTTRRISVRSMVSPADVAWAFRSGAESEDEEMHDRACSGVKRREERTRKSLSRACPAGVKRSEE